MRGIPVPSSRGWNQQSSPHDDTPYSCAKPNRCDRFGVLSAATDPTHRLGLAAVVSRAALRADLSSTDAAASSRPSTPPVPVAEHESHTDTPSTLDLRTSKVTSHQLDPVGMAAQTPATARRAGRTSAKRQVSRSMIPVTSILGCPAVAARNEVFRGSRSQPRQRFRLFQPFTDCPICHLLPPIAIALLHRSPYREA